MSAQEGHPQHASVTHHDARIGRLERVLRAHGGTLTPPRLFELSGAEAWDTRDGFDAVLAAAVRDGRIEMLGGVLVHATGD